MTMRVEPGVLDANILAYAVNADAAQHAASRALLEAARDPSITLYVTSQILCEFYSLITNPRRVAVASSPTEGLRIISAMLAFPGLHVLPAPAHTVAGWMDYCGVTPSRVETYSTYKLSPPCRPMVFSESTPSTPMTLTYFPNSQL
jgi:hypothetical protein